MSRLYRSVVALFLMSFLTLVGCGPPSAADMEKSWHTAEENAQKRESQYPGFKPAIEDLLTKTKAEFDEAKKADEKSRGDKMKVAVDKLTSSMKAFDTYEAELDKLNKLMKDKDLQNLPASKFNPPNDAAKDAIKKADSLVKEGKPANMGEAQAKLEEATKGITEAEKGLEALRPPKGSGASTSSPGGTSSPTSSPASSK